MNNFLAGNSSGSRWALICVSGMAVAAPAAFADVQTVYVYDFDFSTLLPTEGEVTDAVINVGDTINWVWLNDFHNVASVIGSEEEFLSDIFETGDSFQYRFTVPGVHTYYCQPHASDNGDGTATGMVGTITVLPSPAAIVPFIALAAGRRRRPG